MKPVQIGILVLIGAMGGALIMKFSQRQPPGVVPAPIVSAAPVEAPPPAETPPAVEPPAVAERVPVAEPAPSPFPEKAAPVHVPRTKSRRAVVTRIAQNRLPAPPAEAPETTVSEPSDPPPVQEREPAPTEVPPPVASSANTEPVDTTASEPPPQAAPSVTLRAGMLLQVRLGENLSSEHNQTGDAFTATLDAPLVADGFVIAERGARLEGRITEAQKASHTKGQSALSLELTKLDTSDGQHVGIQTDPFRKQAANSTDQNVGIVAAAAGVGGIIGAMAGGGKGAGIGAAAGGAAGAGGVIATRAKPVAIATETKISFRLRQAVTITEQMSH